MPKDKSVNKAFRDKVAKWNESKFKHIDIIVSSGVIKKEFFARCKVLNLDPMKVAMKAGIKPSTFKTQYINEPEPVCTQSFDQMKFIKMIAIVGVEIKVLTILQPFNEVYVNLEQHGLLNTQNDE